MFRFLSAILFGLLLATSTLAQETTTKIVKRADGTTFTARFYDHEKYRARMHKFHSTGETRTLKAAPWPSGPKTFDYCNMNFPMYGNDQYGDCFYAEICHHDQLFTGNNGAQSSFALGTFSTNGTGILNRYRTLSGGDFGLADEDVQGEWKNRYLADVKAATAFDFLYIDTTNPDTLTAAMRELGGVAFTFTVADNWMDNFKTGMVWDASNYNQNNNGHAVLLGGRDDANKRTKLITWATYVWITDAAIRVCNPGGFVVCSTRWFNAKGFAPTGKHITEVSNIIAAAGGNPFPASVISQFPPIAPPQPPNPPPPGPAQGKIITKMIIQIPGQPDQVLPDQVLPFTLPAAKPAIGPNTTLKELLDMLNPPAPPAAPRKVELWGPLFRPYPANALGADQLRRDLLAINERSQP